jgi:hypothetical protein
MLCSLGTTEVTCPLSHYLGARLHNIKKPQSKDGQNRAKNRQSNLFSEEAMRKLRSLIAYLYDELQEPGNPDSILNRFLLQRWRYIEEMLRAEGAGLIRDHTAFIRRTISDACRKKVDTRPFP